MSLRRDPRRRGSSIYVGFVLSLLVAAASGLWLHTSAAALPQVRRGPARAQARALARGAWARVEAGLLRGELPSPATADGVVLEVERAGPARVEVSIRATVPAGPEELVHALRVRARLDGKGRWWVVSWVERGA